MSIYMSAGKQARAEWQRILEAHGYACYYCGRSDVRMIREHMFPRRRGGGDELENIVPACARCNGQKRDRTPLEWFLERGEKQPKKLCRVNIGQPRQLRRNRYPERPHPHAQEVASPCVCGSTWFIVPDDRLQNAYCFGCKKGLLEALAWLDIT